MLGRCCRGRSNRSYGISIGHNDTDNVMRNDEIRDSGLVGVLFRDQKRGRDFWPNRNTLEKNRVIDSGGETGVAIDIQGQTNDTRLLANEIRETHGPMKRIGIRIAAQAGNLELARNSRSGFADGQDMDIVDQRPAA